MYFIIINLSLCLIYKLNFIIGMCVQEKIMCVYIYTHTYIYTHVYIGSGVIHGFKHPLQVLQCILKDKGGLLHAFFTLCWVLKLLPDGKS